MPLISHSPKNQLMNSTGLVFGEVLRAFLQGPPHLPCTAPITAHPPPSPHMSPLPAVGLRLCDKGRPAVPASSGMSSQEAPPLVLVKQS